MQSKTLQRLCLGMFVLAMAGCTSLPSGGPRAGPESAPARFPAEPYETAAEAGRQVYRIDPDASRLLIQVYRGGRLARLGHDHTISSGAVQGLVLLADPITDSRADLYVPVTSLVVDAPEDRAAAGPEFAGPVDEAAARGTLENLRSEAVLDADRFPYVVAAVRIDGVRGRSVDLALDLTIRGTRRRITCPAELGYDPERLRIRATLDLHQSDFGITPFSVLSGALTVQDRVLLIVDLAARRVSTDRPAPR